MFFTQSQKSLARLCAGRDFFKKIISKYSSVGLFQPGFLVKHLRYSLG